MNSHATSLPTPDFKHAVALQFATRPTLRQVAGQRILQLLNERYPVIATVQPPLTSAEPLQLLVPQADKESWSPQPLMEVVLQAVLDGKALDLGLVHGREHRLGFASPHHLLADDDGDVIAFDEMTEAINDLVLELPYYFQQAQVDYWHGESGSGVSRDRWLQQTLKTALLRNLTLQNLDTYQQACIFGLLKGGSKQPSVFSVEAQFEADGDRFLRMLPNLLVIAEWDEREVVLWCSPSSVVKCFDSFHHFAWALHKEWVEHYKFDSMSLNRYELEGDAFSQQAALMLEAMLDSLQRLRHSRLADVAQLEQAYAALSDPAQWFIEGYLASIETSLQPPPGLHGASAGDSFAFQCGLFDLALAQAESKGVAALEDVLDLHSFASQRLREQLLADHPVDANYFPDDLNLTLTVARGMPGGPGAGVGGGVVETRTMTLTQFAIGNLSSLQGATLTAVEHREGQLIMEWMNVDYVRSLVEQVDIGGHYPSYLAQKLDDPATRRHRISCFAREWRCSFLFSALKAKLNRTLSEAGLQCVADYCRDELDRDLPASMLMPLAFKREPAASESDVVSGMYVLFSAQLSVVLLYRPLYRNAPLMEFASLEAMMIAIRQEGALQDSILDWLKPQARRVYDHGGFSEPHLGRPIIDTSILPEAVKPVTFDPKFWRLDVDVKLYQANRDLLVELAGRQSVSNAESHWAILSEGAWLLFDVATLLLRGPVATVAWLVQAIHGVKSDVSALTEGSAFERSAAVVDLVLNLGMALFHTRLPQVERPVLGRLPDVTGFDGPAILNLEPESSDRVPALAVGNLGLPGSLAERPGTQLNFSWRTKQGLNALPTEQRKALLAMRSGVSLNGLQVLESGPARGLYSSGGRFYTALLGDAYLVDVTEQGVRVIGTQGQLGPWLLFQQGQWRVDSGLRLLGGGPRRRAALVREENQKQFDALNERQDSIILERNRAAEAFELSKTAWGDRKSHVERLQAQRDKVPQDSTNAGLIQAFDKKIADAQADSLKAKYQVTEDLKELIKMNLRLDQLLAEMFQPKYAKNELMMVATIQRSAIRQELIDHIVALYNDTAIIINDLNVQRHIDEMAVRPINDIELTNYDLVRALVEKVVALQLDLIWASTHLDRLLPETLKDDSIVFKDPNTGERQNKQSELQGLIEQRRLTNNDLRVHLLDYLAELSLDRRAQVDEETLIQYQQKLWNEELSSAGSAHGELAVVDVPLADRISVLTGVLKYYRAAQGGAAYLEETGGSAINAASLKDYQGVLEELIRSASEELAQAIRESELSETVLLKPRVYQRRNGRHRVVQTRSGHSIIGEELEVDGVSVVQQRDASGDKVLKTFNRQDEHWVERVDEPLDEIQPLPNSRDVGAARSNARAVLGQVESVVRLARQYINSDQPIGMQSVIEGHVNKLNEAGQALESTGIAREFDGQLEDAVGRLKENQRVLLTSFYLTTSYPTAASLRYLFSENKITIRRTESRTPLELPNDYLDVYEVRRVPSDPRGMGAPLWEAHFHYRDANSPARQFIKGHLKIWSQRKLGRRAQMEAARSNSGELLAIHRGNLTLSEVDGVIPFD